MVIVLDKTHKDGSIKGTTKRYYSSVRIDDIHGHSIIKCSIVFAA